MEKESPQGKKGLPKYEILKPFDEDFDHNTCFNNKVILDEKTYSKENDYYFDSYSHFSIHEEMLKDRVSL
jgi:protein arginine N-methyltransferase 1